MSSFKRSKLDEYLTLPSSESSKNVGKGISMQENLLWGCFVPPVGSES